MSAPRYPFAALVGLDTLTLALTLCAIESHLSLLIRGDKGAAKTTASRALAELLGSRAPFVNLPIGTTEDRLLGGLDLEGTLQGQPRLRAGLVAAAHGGVLYIDEVNLIAPHLADALLDATASGVLHVEREGFSVAQAAEFVLIGSMNPEEGALRPQLLDRFALVVDVAASLSVDVRTAVLTRRLAFDADPEGFRRQWARAQEDLGAQLATARRRLADCHVPAPVLRYCAERVAALGIRSMRADIATVRAARAYAAWLRSPEVTSQHVDTVLPLAVAHRLPPGAPRPESPRSHDSAPLELLDSESHQGDSPGEGMGGSERVFASLPQRAPRLRADEDGVAHAAGVAAALRDASNGPAIGWRRTAAPSSLHVRASVVQAVSTRGTPELRRDDLHEVVRAPLPGTRIILVVDSSGSHAALERMRVVKGVIGGLLDASLGRNDEVVVIACRGPAAEVLVEPTTSRLEVDRALEYLPTGGRTPLAHGLELARLHLTTRAIVVVVTDGRANVPTKSGDAWADTLDAARCLQCAALLVSTDTSSADTGRPQALAQALRARCVSMTSLDPNEVLTLVRGAS